MKSMNRNAVRVIAETANSIHQTHPTFLPFRNSTSRFLAVLKKPS